MNLYRNDNECRLALEAQHFYQMESERQLVKYNEATVFALLLVRAW